MGNMKAAACLQRYDDEDQVTEEAMQLHHAIGTTRYLSYFLSFVIFSFLIFHFSLSETSASRTEEEKKRGVSVREI
jgi:hypothetical protein